MCRFKSSGWCKVKNILAHRRTRGGVTEYQVDWQGINPSPGQPWTPWWLPADALTPDLISDYHTRFTVPNIKPYPVQVDAAKAFKVMRRSVGHALMFGAPKEAGFQGRNRPCVHKLEVKMCMYEPVALAVLDMARKYGGKALALQHGNIGKPGEWWQLIIKDLDRIATFCEFQSFVDCYKAIDNVRITGAALPSGPATWWPSACRSC